MQMTMGRLLGGTVAAALLAAGAAQAQTKLVTPDPTSLLKKKNVLVLEGPSGSHAQTRANARDNLQKIIQPAVGFKLTIGNTNNINDAYLAPYDIIVFNYFFNTEKVFPGTGAETAFKAWLAKGHKGYIGYHTSGANEYSKSEWVWYQDNVTGMRYNVFHPDVPQGTISKTTDAAVLAHPIMNGLPATNTMSDEWYEYETTSKMLDPSFGAKIMYYLDNPAKVGVGRVPAPIHPTAWYREDVATKNRFFYSTFLHVPEEASKPFFQSLILRALEYVSGYDSTTSAISAPQGAPALAAKNISYVTDSRQLHVNVDGQYRLSIRSTKGEEVFSTQGNGQMTFAPAALQKAGLYIVKVESKLKTYSQRLMVY